MIAVAHDVLLAYLIEGDSDRAKRAARVIEGEVDEGRQVFVSALTLARVATELTDQRAFASGCSRVYSFDEGMRYRCRQP